jgi:PIN domain nuclease of toxin-antitoxin system
MMRVLLDTHVLLWALMKPTRLPAELLDALSDPRHQVMFSAVNVWEIAIKKFLRKPDFGFGPDEVLQAARAAHFAELPVSAEHAARILTLEALHRDPFDRMLIAQALCENARLLTADRAIARYSAPIDLMIPQ